MEQEARGLRATGRSEKTIARRLGVSRSLVSHVLTKPLHALPAKRGRPRKLSADDDRAMRKRARRLARRHEGAGSRSYARALQQHRGKRVHPSTARRHLLRMGLRAKKPTKKPLLTHDMMRRRLEFARANVGREDWGSVMFCDESDFSLQPRVHVVRARRGERVIVATEKHPPKVHVWGCICGAGAGRIFLFAENMDQLLYLRIIRESMLPSFERLLPRRHGERWVLQQDLDPKHKAMVCRQELAHNNIDWLEQPPQSPDLNPIENLWGTLKDRVAARRPRTVRSLKACIESEWKKLGMAELLPLVNSMSGRLRQVIGSEGGRTKY